MSQTVADDDVELLNRMAEDTDQPKLCQSNFHANRPAHEAHWTALTGCGAMWLMCEARRLEAANDNGWLCKPGCGVVHYYDDIVWVPIQS